MQFSESGADGGLQITAYEPGEVKINKKPYTENLIITATDVTCPWHAPAIEALQVSDFAFLENLDCKIFLLGTGQQLHFPPKAVLDFFQNAKIGLECMQTAAACRTYNVLRSEHRAVIAALFI